MRISDWSSDVCSSDLCCVHTWNPVGSRSLHCREPSPNLWLGRPVMAAGRSGDDVSRSESIVRAFGEEHVSRLTGLSVGQLRAWDRRGFFSPHYEIGIASCRERVCLVV